MATFVLAWPAGGAWTIVEIVESKPTVLGRGESVDVSCDDLTVSRRHARISCRDGRWSVTNLSATNPARRNAEALARPTALADRDRLTLGDWHVVFHDLRAGDRISGLKCSHCGRENDAAQVDCWFCGTAMVNASSTTRTRRPVICRVIAGDGQVHDLYRHDALALYEGEPTKGSSRTAGAAQVQVRVTDLGPALVSDGPVAVSLNYIHAPGEHELATGDRIDVEGATFTLVVR